MENEAVLEKHGLFTAKVPRFTSYPPANRFEPDTGQRHQAEWLGHITEGSTLSLYVHIPFCKRLCYFCACRTQGTQTLKPVEAYVDTLIKEICVVRAQLAPDVKMARLHFGGGTPTILSSELMNRLCEVLFSQFKTKRGFEFSVEIDPTDASDAVLETLAAWRLGRASIGIQDFAPKVQTVIGREQSFQQTKTVIEKLRQLGVGSINFDLVYGLPHQTRESLSSTLDRVLELQPDRLAIYGYAHVPQMSKRQVMIQEDDLADARERWHLATLARRRMIANGMEAIGIDHFALPQDSLARAARHNKLRRNFQGYTDDPCRTLIGFGASAISEYPEGYVQNAVSTAAYSDRVQRGGLAGHRGYAMTPEDKMRADLIQELMCRGGFNFRKLMSAHPFMVPQISAIVKNLRHRFKDALSVSKDSLHIRAEAESLSRVIASAAVSESLASGSLAI